MGMIKKILQRYKNRKVLKEDQKAYDKVKKTLSNDCAVPDFTRRIEILRMACMEATTREPYEAVYTIGWLGSFVPNTGSVSKNVLSALSYFAEHSRTDQGELGFHTCEICGEHRGRGEFVVETETTKYWLPQMVLHYIQDHGYCPPSKFINELEELWQNNNQ